MIKKYRYFCEKCEKDVVIEATTIIENFIGGTVIKCGPVKCSEKSYYPYSCSLGRIDDCAIVQEITEEIESSYGNF